MGIVPEYYENYDYGTAEDRYRWYNTKKGDDVPSEYSYDNDNPYGNWYNWSNAYQMSQGDHQNQGGKQFTRMPKAREYKRPADMYGKDEYGNPYTDTLSVSQVQRYRAIGNNTIADSVDNRKKARSNWSAKRNSMRPGRTKAAYDYVTQHRPNGLAPGEQIPESWYESQGVTSSKDWADARREYQKEAYPDVDYDALQADYLEKYGDPYKGTYLEADNK